MFLISQLTVVVEKGNSFDLTGSKDKKILILEKQGTTEASLIVIRFGSFWQVCVNKYDAWRGLCFYSVTANKIAL